MKIAGQAVPHESAAGHVTGDALYTDDLDSAQSVILSLALTIEARDPYTLGHCDRLSRYALGVGEALGVDEDRILVVDQPVRRRRRDARSERSPSTTTETGSPTSTSPTTSRPTVANHHRRSAR